MFPGRHYQNAYVCADLEAAIGEFRHHVPGGEVPIIDIDFEVRTPEGPRRIANRVAMIWVEGLQYELIQPIVDETGIYANHGAGGGLLQFHHICRRVDDWDTFREKLDQQPVPVVMERTEHDYPIKFLYVDARPVLGHYLEYCWMSDDMWAFVSAT